MSKQPKLLLIFFCLYCLQNLNRSFPSSEEPCKESSSQKTVAQDLGIQTYGVSMTSLEEVFLKLNEEEEAEEAQADDVLGTSGRSLASNLS